MSSLVHRWLLLCGLTLFLFKGYNGFFLRHVQSGKCITKSNERVSNTTSALAYYLVMTNNCLKNSGQFFYRDNKILHNTETGEALQVAFPDKMDRNRLAVCQDESTTGDRVQFLKQTAAGTLQFYQSLDTRCAKPSESYVMRTTYCDREEQKFTFGSVTNYGDQMENVQCSPIQRMAIKTADYGDFNNNDVFDRSPSVNKECSALSNCQIKSLCGGKRSCTLTMDDTLLAPPYCRDTSKKIYTKYTCVDSKSSSLDSTITKATKIRLSHEPNEGTIGIKDGSTPWRKVKEVHWNKNRQKMLCQHLGFKVTDANDIRSDYSVGRGRNIATGSLICYSTRPSETSCCIHLVPSTSISNSMVTWVKCKICDNQLSLSDKNKFPPKKVFRGSGGSENYRTVRSNKGGWCASGSTPYILIDLQKEYHLTHIMVVADKEQTNWSSSYTMKYSRVESSIGETRSKQIEGNQNGYRASITQLDSVYNARYIKIQSRQEKNFCLRIALCGEVQTPAPAYNLMVTPYQYAARVQWNIRTTPEESSYITKIIIYLDGSEYETISQRERTSIVIKEFKPNTRHKVEIQTEDAYLQNKKVSQMFRTKTAGKICEKPLLQDTHTFPDSVFRSSSGGGNYQNARLTGSGWCASGSTPYLLIDLQREYHLTQFVVITHRIQRGSTYSLTYSRTKSSSRINWSSPPIQIRETRDKPEPTIKQLNGVYNARYIKIQSTATGSFCLRIELCGEVQTPAPAYNLRITPYQYAARVTWNIRTEPQRSSYITKTIIYINGLEYQVLSQRQRTQSILIKRFKPSTRYKIEIQTEDAYSAIKVSKDFTTQRAGKICEKPLLQHRHTFTDRVFYSGRGGGNYRNARLTKTGWCPSGSTPYLFIDLQREYHLTHVVVITDKTQRSSSTYSLTYRRVGSLWNNEIQITDDQEYRPSIKNLDGAYNARFIRIQSTATGHVHFCLRIELCGEVQKPALVSEVDVRPSSNSAQVRWKTPTEPAQSSYITKYDIYLNGQYQRREYRSRTTSTNAITISKLEPYTEYTVGIVAFDANSLSSKINITFTTTTAAPSGAPTSVKFTKRSRNKLAIYWRVPSKNALNGVLTGYKVCYAEHARSRNPNCSEINADSHTAQISNLRPATKYFVTVQAGTAAGFGRKSWPEISKITNGERVNPVATSYASLSLNITKQAPYIKGVMIIVNDTEKSRGVEEIGRSDLKPYDANTRDLYVTAYLDAKVLPLTFMIGDGKEYIYGRQKYLNQPLKQDTNYVVFLRFFERWGSYYSTQWSDVVKTFAKPPAPVNLNCFSTAPKKYTISWTQPLLPDQTSVLRFHGNFSSSNGSSVTLSITAEMRSVTVDVEFKKQYTFKIQVETKAGKSRVKSKSWTSHSAPLKPRNVTDG